MNKRFILTAALGTALGMVWLLNPLSAQAGGVESVHDLKRVEIELHVGPSVPLGSFGAGMSFTYCIEGEKNAQDVRNLEFDYHGAKVGVNYGLSLGYYATSNWGVIALFNGHSLKQGGSGAPYKQDKYDWQRVGKGDWTEFMAMAGASYRFMPVRNLLLSARAFIGYAHLKSPHYEAVAVKPGSENLFKMASSKSHNFGYGAGVAVSYAVARGFHLHLRADYMGAVPFRYNKVEGHYNYSSTNGNLTRTEDFSCRFRENFQVVNVSFGLTFCL